MTDEVQFVSPSAGPRCDTACDSPCRKEEQKIWWVAFFVTMLVMGETAILIANAWAESQCPGYPIGFLAAMTQTGVAVSFFATLRNRTSVSAGSQFTKGMWPALKAGVAGTAVLALYYCTGSALHAEANRVFAVLGWLLSWLLGFSAGVAAAAELPPLTAVWASARLALSRWGVILLLAIATSAMLFVLMDRGIAALASEFTVTIARRVMVSLAGIGYPIVVAAIAWRAYAR